MIAYVLVASACTAGDTSAVIPEHSALVMWNSTSLEVLHSDVDPIVIDTGEAQVSQVTPSGDGRLVWTTVDPDVGSFSSVISGLDGAGQVTVTVPTSPFFYIWSPDSTQLGFMGNDPEGRGVLFGIIVSDSGVAREIEVGAPFYVDWSDASDRLAVHLGGDWLGFIDAATGEVTNIPRLSGGFPAPAWTPNGVLMVMARGPSAGAGTRTVSLQTSEAFLALVDPQSSEIVTLATTTSLARFFADSEGHRVALIDGIPGAQQLRVLSIGDGIEVDTVNSGLFDVAQWSPDGTRLLFTSREDPADPLVPSVWQDGELTEFDGYLPSATFATAYIPFWDQFDRSVSLWAPDSNSFVLPARDDDGPYLRVHNLADGSITRHGGFSMGVYTR